MDSGRQTGIASRSTRSRMRGRRPRSVTTSTRRPSRSCRSISSPPMSNRLRPGVIRTRKSISLDSSASPRATEPKTRTSVAPYFVARRRTSARWRSKVAAAVMFPRYVFVPVGSMRRAPRGVAWSVFAVLGAMVQIAFVEPPEPAMTPTDRSPRSSTAVSRRCARTPAARSTSCPSSPGPCRPPQSAARRDRRPARQARARLHSASPDCVREPPPQGPAAHCGHGHGAEQAGGAEDRRVAIAEVPLVTGESTHRHRFERIGGIECGAHGPDRTRESLVQARAAVTADPEAIGGITSKARGV